MAKCVLGKELFWPTDDQNHNLQLPFWPHLTDLSVGYEPVTPSGHWMYAEEGAQESEYKDGYHLSDPGSDNEMDDTNLYWIAPEDRDGRIFRIEPIHESFDAYFLSAANAALRMPKLDNMVLEVTNAWNRHKFSYTVRNGVANATWFHDYAPSKVYRPSDKVLQLWKQVASARTGGELEIEFTELI